MTMNLALVPAVLVASCVMLACGVSCAESAPMGRIAQLVLGRLERLDIPLLAFHNPPCLVAFHGRTRHAAKCVR